MLPDLNWVETTNLCELRPFAVANAQIYAYKDGCPKVFKFHGNKREIDMVLIAGDCSVRLCERVVYPELDGTLSDTMMRETSLNITATDPARRLILMHGMIYMPLVLVSGNYTLGRCRLMGFMRMMFALRLRLDRQ